MFLNRLWLSHFQIAPEWYLWYITDELIDTDKIKYPDVDMQQLLN